MLNSHIKVKVTTECKNMRSVKKTFDINAALKLVTFLVPPLDGTHDKMMEMFRVTQHSTQTPPTDSSLNRVASQHKTCLLT